MKWALVTGFLTVLVLVAWLSSAVNQTEQPLAKPYVDFAVIDSNDSVRTVTLETPTAPASSTVREVYPDVVPITIAGVRVDASVADTDAARAAGLSGTPYLPETVVKLFVFDTDAKHGFWMKDMNYPIDIIWVSRDLKIVHIEPSVTPDSFPRVYAPNVPARYVIETSAGFARTHQLGLDDQVSLSPDTIE